jgi:hypothetical protein
MAYIRQSRPDSGLGFHLEIIRTILGVPSSLVSDTRSNRSSERRGEQGGYEEENTQ